MIIHIQIIFYLIIAYEFLKYVKILNLIKQNLIIYKKINKVFFSKKISDQWKQKSAQAYSKKLFVSSFKLIFYFSIIVFLFLLFLFFDKKFIFFINSLYGLIELTLIFFIYRTVRKKINAKL
jgi:hypothetical protein